MTITPFDHFIALNLIATFEQILHVHLCRLILKNVSLGQSNCLMNLYDDIRTC